ncbi:MAG: phospho-N-acetylmuramoyl-pentapeptide-transferase [Sphaerochaetaceae bacterium]|jgi:phospho-N-acetylmuramoyl-pentapeptide-transferase|nr:phospho-N-acetylmuramoyl-pentapeptide-transferase [Sphaerochaetaceae bacterium]NLO61246.1 phospho-N-acetylmuramoyl-pentapeptide-transferase [Spirochaetales bacterium]MDD2406911.1 phospho-N-acetylmuramoyl-pentapeptide-transferase [Sphaerochaetaceae bacterium]MDD3670225.1 phospho-N-acetylmuramoyl-pentapeptide-transferase [Sphaerochaetaceae bacterium]MDD4259106.1 phospho-N-acetylmuramoyl-pentapeptide-transferase [Sphaerochaetaceae bacterium]
MSDTVLIVLFLGSFFISWAIGMVLGSLYVRIMQKFSVGQIINPDGPAGHASKAGTPTAGGLFFLLASTITITVFYDITKPFTYIILVAMWLFGTIGMIDDIIKLYKHRSVGLTSSRKLALQILASAAIVWLLNSSSSDPLSVITIPWDPSRTIDIGLWYPLGATLYMVAFVNATNITDGLDGLATGTSLPILLLIVILSACIGFGLTYPSLIRDPQEYGMLTGVLAAFIGAVLAFLWFNVPKAQVFMGDCGSHAIGAVISVSALLLKIELVVIASSLVLIVELLSSFIQIIAIRFTGKKVFLMAPLHHHFEKRGVEEAKITSRFVIVSTLCAVLAGLMFIIKQL